MKYKIIISKQADSDLRGIYEYIAFELQSVQNANGQLNRLEESILGLKEMPNRFREYEKEPWHGRGLRMMPVDNYIIFYIPDNKKHQITILRVMYAGRNVDKQL